METLAWLALLGTLLDAAPAERRPDAASVALLRPIRTNEPGTGVFIGSGLLGRLVTERQSSEAGDVLWDTRWITDFRYTPSTHWVVGVQVPFILNRTLDHPGVAVHSAGGLGDVQLSIKRRFFRSVGMWSDRHAAVEVDLKLPTGSTEQVTDGRLPIQRRRQLQPGTGSTDVTVDLVYQEGRRRLVYGGDVSYRFNTEDDEQYRFGNELRANVDLEYILFPLEYRTPGNELFVLLEAAIFHKQADEVGNASLVDTERTEVLLAPGIQYIATEQMLVSLSVQFPLYADVAPTGLRRDLNLLAEFRYAF